MLYGIDGKPLQSDDQVATRLYQVQLMNMILFLREELRKVADLSNEALTRLDRPEHKLECRLLKDVRDKALDAIQQQTVSGFLSGFQSRLAYEICEKLIAEAILFDAADNPPDEAPATDCQDLVKMLIQQMLVKLAPEEQTMDVSGAARE